MLVGLVLFGYWLRARALASIERTDLQAPGRREPGEGLPRDKSVDEVATLVGARDDGTADP